MVGGGIGHGQDGKLLQHTVERQQDRGRHDIKDRVDDGNAEGVGRVGKEAEPDQRVQAVEPAQEDDGADQVEIQMDKKAVRLAFLLAPAEEISAVTVVPMFWPMMMGTAAE